MDDLIAEEEAVLVETATELPRFRWEDVIWYNVLVMALWHIGSLYALLVVIPQSSLARTVVCWGVLAPVSGLGITAGAHRLWSHKAYKAKLPLRVFLMALNSMAFQGTIYDWTRDHRTHHKGSDTTADPHNSHRGFFFSHIGWTMTRKHQNERLEGKKISMTDLLEDPVVTFQMRHYLKTVLIMCYGLPTGIGYLMGSAWAGFWVGSVLRHVCVLHMTWFVNSIAHFYGYRPYDANIRATENLIVSIGAIGEGYHNYHHKYPSDYATSEYGLMSGYWNPTKLFIDACAALGLAYDLKRSRTATATRERLAISLHQQKLKESMSQLLGQRQTL